MSRFGPRDSLRQPFEGYPAYGALHPAIPNQQLREFYFDQTRIADYFIVNRLAGVQVEPLTFDPEIDGVENPLVIEERAREAVIDTYNPNRFYRMFNPDTLGVTVVEMDGSSRVANRMRVVWESQDFGAVEQEAVNEIGRTLPNIVPRLIFNGARGAGGRLPNVPNTEVRQKMALMPDQNQHQATQKLLESEAGIIGDAIRRRMKQYLEPWDYMPHLTYMVFRRETQPADVQAIIKTTNNYLQRNPFGVALDPLEIRSKSTR